MLVPPPNGVGVDRGAHQRLELVLAGRADDRVGQPPDVAAAVPHQVAQALAARVDDAVERVGRDLLGADRVLQGGAQTGRQRRLRDGEVVEGDRAGRHALHVEVERPLDERPERGLVLVRERDSEVAPPPPLHRALGGRRPRCFVDSHAPDDTQSMPVTSRTPDRSSRCAGRAG
jgi:hypothetical protein